MKNLFEKFQLQRVFKKGEILYYENTPSFGLYCIESGTVKIISKDSKSREVILRLASEGDIFGYNHLIGEKLHKNTAKAVEDTRCYFIDEMALRDLMLNDPALSGEIMKLIGRELMDSHDRCIELIKKNVRQRLASYFRYMSHKHGVEVNGKIKIRVQLSREEIASIIGTASETTIRFISEFKELGLIQEEDRFFHIMNPEGLNSIGHL
jgi:CRP-like cAMP-binding protein